MKNLLLLFLLTSLFSCSNDKIVETKIKVEPAIEFTKYTSVIEMLRASYDFSEEQGALKVLSKDGEPLHIQVSGTIVDGELEKVIIDQTKRDIIYVAFQSFAQTDINELTITSIPMKAKDKYENKYKITVTINRETAKNILKKYLNTENFQELFKLDGTLWLPSEKFDNLKFENLDAVFMDIKG